MPFVRPPTLYDLSAFVWFVLTGLVALITVWDYGISWDEMFRWHAGEEKLAYYRMLFSGEGVGELSVDLYPGLFDMLVALLQLVSPFPIYTTGHLLSIFFGLLTLLGTWLVCHKIAGARAAFFALVLLTLTPRFYGHMFFNPKDIPFASLYIFTVYVAILCLGNTQKRPWKMAVFLGISIGLCMGVRTAGVITLVYLAAFVGYELLRERSGLSAELWRRKVLRELGWGITVFIIAILVLLPWWPYAQQNPLFFLMESAQSTAGFAWSGDVLFMGERISGTDIPFYYFPIWYAITLPPATIFLLVLGLIAMIRIIATSITNRSAVPVLSNNKFRDALFVAIAILFPLVYSIVTQPVVYDGLRHLLFTLPLMAVLAAIAWDYLCGLKYKLHIPVQALLIVSLLWTGKTMVALHPYQYIYFNPVVGGLPGAYGKFDLDYWGLSYREAAEALAVYAGERALSDPNYVLRVATIPPYDNIPVQSSGRRVVPPPILATTFYTERMLEVDGDSHPDFYIALNRLDFPHLMEGPIIYKVERHGVPLSIIRLVNSGYKGNLNP